MRRILIAAAAFALSTSFAFADDIMASRYGNTTISTDAGGVQTKLYYNADGTFTGVQASQKFSGTWKLDSGTLCLTFSAAVAGAANPTCLPASVHKVGDTWAAPGGRTVQLVQGIQ